MPKFKLLYFKNLLDVAFNKFFEFYEDAFIKQDDIYILASNFSKQKIAKIFKAIVIDELKHLVVKYDPSSPQYLIIIGACMPADNLLLKYNNAFPNKLHKLISSKYHLKYVLKEDDIKIDTIKFNEACIEVFNSFFIKNCVEKVLGKEHNKSIMFIQHNRLDCYSMFKTVKSILGKANCTNVYEKYYSDVASPIVAINDLIDKYASKTAANNDEEFKNILVEIKTYIKERLGYGN